MITSRLLGRLDAQLAQHRGHAFRPLALPFRPLGSLGRPLAFLFGVLFGFRRPLLLASRPFRAGGYQPSLAVGPAQP